jgi:hypothetical protein
LFLEFHGEGTAPQYFSPRLEKPRLSQTLCEIVARERVIAPRDNGYRIRTAFVARRRRVSILSANSRVMVLAGEVLADDRHDLRREVGLTRI